MARSNLVSISVGYSMPLQIILKNTQSVASPSPFQQMLQLEASEINNVLPSSTPQVASDFHNIRFKYNYNYIPAWLESINNGVATIWVNVPVSIPANSSITIDMEVDPSLNFDGNYWGEAPQLSPSYAEYDNGASVFNNYWNFAGTSVPSGINQYVGAGSVTFNNGVTIKGDNTGGGDVNSIATSTSFSAPIIVDYYGTQVTAPYPQYYGFSFVGFATELGYAANGGGTFDVLQFSNGINAAPSTSQGGTAVNGTLSAPSNNLFPESVWTQIYTSSTYYTYQNYVNSTGYVTEGSNTASLPFVIQVGNNEASYAPSGMTVYWLRTRAYPPNGVMPSVEVIA